jgi:hypothetical protein
MRGGATINFFRPPCRNRRGPNVTEATGRVASSSEWEKQMQYMLLIYGEEAKQRELSQEQFGQIYAAYVSYTDAMKKAGVFKAGDPLQPTSTATTVRAPDGKTKVLNGPYAESREQLGGYYLIDTPDLDGALSWASRCPGAQFGAIEVRPIRQM